MGYGSPQQFTGNAASQNLHGNAFQPTPAHFRARSAPSMLQAFGADPMMYGTPNTTNHKLD